MRAKSIYGYGRMCVRERIVMRNEGASEERDPFSERMQLQAAPKRGKNEIGQFSLVGKNDLS